MIRWTTLLIFSAMFVFVFSVPVYAAGGVSMTMEPNHIEVGKSGKLFVDVDPAGSSLNIIQATVSFDPAAWNATSCTPHESFQGIAGKSGCVVDNAAGVVRLQMETRSTRGPKQKTRVAAVVMNRKGSGDETITMPPGQIVVQNDNGQSSLLPMSNSVRVEGSGGGKNTQSVSVEETGSGTSEPSSGIDLTQPPEPHDGPSGLFQSIISWFSRLFGR